MRTDSSRILEGIRILDLTRNIAGPVATMLAAEMGADVIKIEPPGGDEMRRWPPFVEGESVYFVSCNRGKRSIVLDLKAEAERATLLKLMADADVVVENYRPGTLEKLGLGWENLKASHPKLVWVSVTGYGRDGPRAGAPAYDSMIQAFAGIMHITGEAGRGPVRSGGSPIDIATAYLAWGSIISGVHSVAKTGRGVLLEVSLMESALGFIHAYLQAALVGKTIPGRLGSETMGLYPMGAFMTEDGAYCLVQVSNEIQWKKLCAVLGVEALVDDPRFATNPDRVTNRDALRPLLQERLLSRPAADWEEALIAAGVPASQVCDMDAVATNDQVVARGMVKEAEIAGGHAIRTWGVPVRVDGLKPSGAGAVPGLDEHRDEILAGRSWRT